MRYPYLTQNDAAQIVTKRRAGEQPDVGQYIKFRGDGQEFDRSSIVRLTEEMMALKSRYPESLRQRDPKGGDFEAEASPIVHETLGLAMQISGDLDYWVYLAVIEFHELVEWRHAQHSALNNYGIGNRQENLFFRMWMRAEIGFNATDRDQYALARKGTQDFWRSHILRVRYGNCRKMARALISFQYPEDDGEARLITDAIRELAKRLRRLYVNLEFAFLDEEKASALLEAETNMIHN